MLKSNVHHALGLILILLFLLSCKKKLSPSAPEDPETPIPVTPVAPKPTDPVSRPMIPLSLTAENLKIDLTYAANQNLLTEIRQSNGVREMITYNAQNQLKEYKRYLKDELLYHVYYVLNTDGLVTKAIQYTVSAGGKLLSPLGTYEISYNSRKEIERVDWYDFKNMLSKSKQYNYNEKLLLTSCETVIPKGGTQTYEYDNNFGIFSQISYLNLISLENEAFYFKNIRANLEHISSKTSASDSLSFVLQYNPANYPSTIKQTDASGKSSTYKIIYR